MRKWICIIPVLIIIVLLVGVPLERYLHKKSVIEKGSQIMATVVDKKITKRTHGKGRQKSHYDVYLVFYTFQTNDNRSVSNNAEISPTKWHRLAAGDTIEIRYDLNNPKFNFLADDNRQNELVVLIVSSFVSALVILGIIINLLKGRGSRRK